MISNLTDYLTNYLQNCDIEFIAFKEQYLLDLNTNA